MNAHEFAGREDKERVVWQMANGGVGDVPWIKPTKERQLRRKTWRMVASNGSGWTGCKTTLEATLGDQKVALAAFGAPAAG